MKSKTYFSIGIFLISVGLGAISWKLGLIWIGVLCLVGSYFNEDEERNKV